MWNLSFTPPQVIEARVLTRLPDSFRRKRRTEWCDANKPGHEIDSFLEGPSFDRAGNLYVTDIPYGRIFRISPALEWTLVAEYDGWPNGMAFHRDGSLWITDYRRGLLSLDMSSRAGASPMARDPVAILGHRNSESFKGLNDLTFDPRRQLLFHRPGPDRLARPERARVSIARHGTARSVDRRHPEPQRRRPRHDGQGDLRRGDAREPGVARSDAGRRLGHEGRRVPHLLRRERPRWHGGRRREPPRRRAREPRRRVRPRRARRGDALREEPRGLDRHQRRLSSRHLDAGDDRIGDGDDPRGGCCPAPGFGRCT